MTAVLVVMELSPVTQSGGEVEQANKKATKVSNIDAFGESEGVGGVGLGMERRQHSDTVTECSALRSFRSADMPTTNQCDCTGDSVILY